MRIFFSVGEPSGDIHGANLIRALQARDPQVECVGYGGPRMAEAGCCLHADLTKLAVMWILRALINLHQFAQLISRADRYFRHHRPDAVVLIDYPGFNWWIARRAKAHGIPVIYYVPPQIWAWLSYRVGKMRKFVDHVLCSLPFEQEWLRSRGCRAVQHVGHPFFDAVATHSYDEAFLKQQRSDARPLVTLLPGSRTQEVTANLPTFLRVAELIAQRVPQARFAVAAFKPHQAEWARAAIAEQGLDIPVFVGRTPELMRAARCCLACSGSVSLELLHHAKPTVIGYQVSRAADFAQRRLMNVPYITLVNLLATGRLGRDRTRRPIRDDGRPETWHDLDDGVLFPEFMGSRDPSAPIAERLVCWLTDDAAYADIVARLERLRDEVGKPGAAGRAADYILSHVPSARPALPSPHYRPSSQATTTIGADAGRVS